MIPALVRSRREPVLAFCGRSPPWSDRDASPSAPSDDPRCGRGGVRSSPKLWRSPPEPKALAESARAQVLALDGTGRRRLGASITTRARPGPRTIRVAAAAAPRAGEAVASARMVRGLRRDRTAIDPAEYPRLRPRRCRDPSRDSPRLRPRRCHDPSPAAGTGSRSGASAGTGSTSTRPSARRRPCRRRTSTSS